MILDKLQHGQISSHVTPLLLPVRFMLVELKRRQGMLHQLELNTVRLAVNGIPGLGLPYTSAAARLILSPLKAPKGKLWRSCLQTKVESKG